LHPFINAKKFEHKISLEVVDLKDNMETKITKWKHIFKGIMANFQSHYYHHHNKPICKDKWRSFYGDYKKIHDYQSVINRNLKYWDMFVEDKVL
jgi:hypothetical protein